MARLHIQSRVLHVSVDPQHHLFLLFDHVRKLLKDPAQFDDSWFDVLEKM